MIKYRIYYSSCIFEQKEVIIECNIQNYFNPKEQYDYVKKLYESEHPGVTVLHVEELERY